MSISLKFLENNFMLIKFNGDRRFFCNYLAVITKRLFHAVIPNKEPGGGWLIHYSHLDLLKKYFKSIEYLNEYTAPPYMDMGKNMKLQPYEYQKEAIYFAINNLNSLMVLPCGAGKTAIAIGIYLEAKERNIVEGQGIIVVKASLKAQWQKEIGKFSDFEAKILQTYSDRCSSYLTKIRKLDKQIKALGKTDAKRKDLTLRIKDLQEQCDQYFLEQFENCDLMVANYETLLDEKVMERLLAKKIECVICDEIHYAKSKDAERSKALYKLADAKLKIGATATPITKDPRDIFGIYKFINPDLLGTYTNFSRFYINFAGYGRINGFKNMDTLKDKIRNNIFVKTKKDVASQLPSLVVYQKYCDLTTKQLEVYQGMLTELDELNEQDFKIRSKCKSETEVLLNEELQKIGGKIMALQTFSQELADTPLLLLESDSEMSKQYAADPKHSPKLDLCMELVDEILQSNEKVIIFSKFERMQDILTKAINKIDKTAKIAYVNGSLSAETRYEEAYTKFRDNPEYKVLLCSDAGAEGLNLGHCKYLIEYDLATSYAIQTQRHGRLERADSVHKNVVVYQLIANDSWDTIQQKIVNKKEGFDTDIIKSFVYNK